MTDIVDFHLTVPVAGLGLIGGSLCRALKEYTGHQVLGLDADADTARQALESGAVEAVAMDEVFASYYITQNDKDFRILDDVIAEEEYGVGFKKGNTQLRDQVNDTLKEMAKDGTLAEISEKWFGEDLTIIEA